MKKRREIRFTSLERIRQEQKDYQEFLQDVEEINHYRDRLLSPWPLTRDEKMQIATKLGEHRRILFDMAGKRWPGAVVPAKEVLKIGGRGN